MTIRRKRIAILSAVCMLAATAYYSGLVSIVWAINRSTDRFLHHPDDARVLYEPGAEILAAAIAQALPQAIDTVERQQYRAFVKPVEVYVCATMDSFASYCPGAGNAGGCVFHDRLFISSKPENTVERMPRLVTHELSHLHLTQLLGPVHTRSALPDWFKEGLAVHISGGGGAETVSELEASEAIAEGRHLLPEPGGSLWQMRLDLNGLPAHMYYRQSAMFVAFLQSTNSSAFRKFLLAVEDGHSFEAVFEREFGESLESAWLRFVASLRSSLIAKPRPDQPLPEA